MDRGDAMSAPTKAAAVVEPAPPDLDAAAPLSRPSRALRKTPYRWLGGRTARRYYLLRRTARRTCTNTLSGPILSGWLQGADGLAFN